MQRYIKKYFILAIQKLSNMSNTFDSDVGYVM